MLKIRIKKWLDSYSADDIKLPRITAGNACFDFYAPQKMEKSKDCLPISEKCRKLLKKVNDFYKG